MDSSVPQGDGPTFSVVFEGRYQGGHDPERVRAAFAERFGQHAARRVFASERAVLKRNVPEANVPDIRRQLAELGMLVTLAPTANAVSPKQTRRPAGPSIVERAAARARIGQVIPLPVSEPLVAKPKPVAGAPRRVDVAQPKTAAANAPGAGGGRSPATVMRSHSESPRRRLYLIGVVLLALVATLGVAFAAVFRMYG